MLQQARGLVAHLNIEGQHRGAVAAARATAAQAGSVQAVLPRAVLLVKRLPPATVPDCVPVTRVLGVFMNLFAASSLGLKGPHLTGACLGMLSTRG